MTQFCFKILLLLVTCCFNVTAVTDDVIVFNVTSVTDDGLFTLLLLLMTLFYVTVVTGDVYCLD